jgi:flavin reductase (DIM6/NTAB) family NADH-FMN oxidoreductase RutF
MGHFATGVTVVTTRLGDKLWGMTANSILSLSLDPPLMLVAVGLGNRIHRFLTESRCFAINILTSEHESISRQFASPRPKDFSGLELTRAETGAPILVEALAYLDCRLVDVVSGGDHDMFLGEPVTGGTREGRPLIFYRGHYAALASP